MAVREEFEPSSSIFSINFDHLRTFLPLKFMIFGVYAWNPLKGQSESDSGSSIEVELALEKFKHLKELEPFFSEAVGYAVFPNIAKGGLGIGGAFGKGQVFKNNKLIGDTSVKQLTVGFQLGAQAFTEIIFFERNRDIERFTEGNFELGAQASAVLIKAGISVETAYSNGVAIFTLSKGGVMYEASIGGQKFLFTPLK